MKRIVALTLALLGLCSCNTGSAIETTGGETAPVEEITTAAETLSEEEIMMQQVKNYNYILGTQAFNPNYQFTEEFAEMEIAGRITEMGSNMIKFHAKDDTMIDKLMEKYHFSHVFMWYLSNSHFKDGYSDAEAEADYTAIYNYTKKLLTDYNGSGVEFYLGHWEGDWYYLDNYNTAQVEVSDVVTEGMIAWLNNRQKAVDDAKRDTPHENVCVWHYLELNRPSDALRDKCDRVVNRVLPYTTVDYVSYSAYDSMDLPARQVARIIEDIYDNLPAKEGVPGPRVFVGEVGQPAANCGFDPEKHRDVNLTNIAKYLACEVKFVLYWQMYDNEKLEDGSCRGFWMINDKNEKQPLYNSFESVLASAKEYVKSFLEEKGRVPTNEEYREYLLSLPEFAK
ncbi:MAG: hypothetical protein IJA85_06385 [Clostridia bacterium]|nr:hypothetical protein [Clostridia bacterium]